MSLEQEQHLYQDFITLHCVCIYTTTNTISDTVSCWLDWSFLLPPVLKSSPSGQCDLSHKNNYTDHQKFSADRDENQVNYCIEGLLNWTNPLCGLY